jgi:CBS domain-containing protein
MRAADIMVRNVITVDPESDVAHAVDLLIDNDVSALPVVDDQGRLVGILSEADLMRRVEINTERPHGWAESIFGASTLAGEFAKAHGARVAEIMTRGAVSVSEAAPLSEIAGALERYRIKRVPVTRDGKVVGIVSRSNVIQALATALHESGNHRDVDRHIRDELLTSLEMQDWTDFGDRNVTVSGGVVHLWGLVGSDEEHKALIGLAESIPGVRGVTDEMIPAY